MKPFDLEAAKRGEPVQTRGGRKVRIVCFDSNRDYPIVALTQGENTETEYLMSYKLNGEPPPYFKDEMDLVMAPKKIGLWLNVYPATLSSGVWSCGYSTEKTANDCSGPERVGGKAHYVEIEV